MEVGVCGSHAAVVRVTDLETALYLGCMPPDAEEAVAEVETFHLDMSPSRWLTSF